ncbi:unnamed protein product [Trichogramma brassicae]|uniref:Uncharacterized protein n=1 Tax=Trichogramma brassicae TaxID=86971 RepID=A0A6H5IW57_9HYME|nr:unnamed protein product [Trichogramma brassicae]
MMSAEQQQQQHVVMYGRKVKAWLRSRIPEASRRCPAASAAVAMKSPPALLHCLPQTTAAATASAPC